MSKARVWWNRRTSHLEAPNGEGALCGAAQSIAGLGSHGKRHRGLAAVAVIAPKVLPTGRHREVRFGYSFYPIPNRNHMIGQSVRIGSRAEHMGARRS